MLDKLIYKELLNIKDRAMANYQSIESDVKRWMKQKSNVSNKLAELKRTLDQRMTDQQEILLERIREKNTRRSTPRCSSSARKILNG